MGKPKGERTGGRLHIKGGDYYNTHYQHMMGEHGLNSSGTGQERVAGFCGCGNKTSGSIKCGEFLDWLKKCC